MEKDYTLGLDAGLVNRGNWQRIKAVMKKAEAGGNITIAFLGGSITQGCLSTTPEQCYAYLIYEWWKKKYPRASITYLNAGIGGTTSQFGVARVDEDVIKYRPDLVFVEFSVNDENTEFFRETYEGLIRHIYRSGPAIMLIHNIKYDDGFSVEEIHRSIGEHYSLPCISMKSTIYRKMSEGYFNSCDITADNLHPNDRGHQMLCDVITHCLEQMDAEKEWEEEAVYLPKALTYNEYECSLRYRAKDFPNDSEKEELIHEEELIPTGNWVQNEIEVSYECTKSKRVSLVEISDFIADNPKIGYDTDIFQGGWTSRKKGAFIHFSVKGSGIAVQYKQSVSGISPVAKVVVDGKEEQAVILDGNFSEDWGDNLAMTTVLHHGENKVHDVWITITQTGAETNRDFCLVSLIISGS